MAGKTKPKQASPLKKGKRQKEKKQKWLGLANDSVEEYYDNYDDYDVHSGGYYVLQYKTEQSHDWEPYHPGQENPYLFKCALCGAVAKGEPKDGDFAALEKLAEEILAKHKEIEITN